MENKINLNNYEEITEEEWNNPNCNYSTEKEGDFIKLETKQNTRYFKKRIIFPITFEDRYGNVFTITRQNLWLRQNLVKGDDYEYDSPLDLDILKEFINDAEKVREHYGDN